MSVKCAAHVLRAENKRPHDFVEEAMRAGRDEDPAVWKTISATRELSQKKRKGWIDNSSFLHSFDASFVGYN